jgi:hypothetical protein
MATNNKSMGSILIIVGGIILLISAFAFFWGANYTNNLQNMASAGFSSLMGETDSTYTLAKLAVNLSPIGFIAGLISGGVGLFIRFAK